jgi:hypothetical protein
MLVVEARVVDATHLELARPIEAPPGDKLVVSLTESGDADAERTGWLAAAARSLSAAYGDSEPEYGVDMVREPNPEYGA